MGIILSAEKLYKTYYVSAGEVHALNGVSVEFEKGFFYAVIGKSGSGKSTLLHILSGLDRPTEGKVLIDGTDIFSYSDEKMAIFRRRHMGFVFQQFNLLEEYTAEQNICMPLKLDGRKADPEFLADVIGYLRLEDKMKKYPPELSGGEQQRVAIARSILARPQLIFADEPTGNLDKKTSEDTLHLLVDCSKKYGQTVIMVTHDLGIAKRADGVIQLEDGKVI